MMRRILAATLLLLLFVGCDEGMDRQPKVKAYDSPPASRDMRLPPAGIIARDVASDTRPVANVALLERGQARFEVFCTPCHGTRGDGDGRIVKAGFPKPPSYHTVEARALEAERLFSVITDGFGTMYGYGDRIAPDDRWAIVAYIRALQLARIAEPETGKAGRKEIP